MLFLGFVGPSYRYKSLPIDSQRCINWYTEKTGNKNSSSTYVLKPTCGYKKVIEIIDDTLPKGSYVRALYRTTKGLGLTPDNGGSVIAVIGPNVYWIKRDFTYQKLGAMSYKTTTVVIS